jgi:hypothetical protein
MKVLIGTPAYGGRVHLYYMNSLLEFQKNGLNFTLATLGNDSLITRARNSIISLFYHQREQYTHLLFLDADVRLPAVALKTLMSFNKDVIGAPVPLKAYSPDGKPQFNFAGLDSKVAEHLYTTKQIGTAVLLLSKSAVIALVEKAIAEGRRYRNWTGYDRNNELPQQDMFDVFRVGVVDGEYLSEDFWVCRELTRLGYPVHVTDAVAVTHHGMHGFQANLGPKS